MAETDVMAETCHGRNWKHKGSCQAVKHVCAPGSRTRTALDHCSVLSLLVLCSSEAPSACEWCTVERAAPCSMTRRDSDGVAGRRQFRSSGLATAGSEPP